MANWKEEFGDRFWSEFNSTTATKERAIQEYNLVEEKHGELWRSLKKEAQDAVSLIGSDGGKLLNFSAAALDGFTITFDCAGHTRRVTAQGNQNHGVHIVVLTPDKENSTQTLKIRANSKNDVEFFSEQGGPIYKSVGVCTPEQ
ncbi:MAG TPA: hypothetical protein VGN44_15385, partial [Candidatus Angelobacter sp.]